MTGALKSGSLANAKGPVASGEKRKMLNELTTKGNGERALRNKIKAQEPKDQCPPSTVGQTKRSAWSQKQKAGWKGSLTQYLTDQGRKKWQ